MDYQKLGSSDLMVSRISFGCMSLKGDHHANAQLLHAAIDRGVNFFDTADLYDKGLNEESVGLAMKDRREKVIIATKVGNQWRPDGSGWDWNPTKSYIKKAVHESLRRLRTDYIDLYQLHGGTIEDPIDDTIAAFEELKQAGCIRYYGISSIRPNVIRTYADRSNIVSNMMQYSLLDRRPEETAFDLLRAKSIGVIVRGAVAKGLLAGKPARPYLSHRSEEVEHIQNLMQSSPSGHSQAQLALRFCLTHPAVSTVAAGIRTISQLDENIGALKVGELSERELRQLRNAAPAARYEKHR